jgi:hypothetical protein
MAGTASLKSRYRVTGVTSAADQGGPPSLNQTSRGINVTAVLVSSEPTGVAETTIYNWRFTDPAAPAFFEVHKEYDLTFTPAADG